MTVGLSVGSAERRSARALRVLLPLLLVLAVSGCSLFRGGSDEKEIFYANEADVAVRVTPYATSKAVGRLALHEPVTRIRVERGFAKISTRRGLEGWVENGQLAAQPSGAGGSAKPPATR